MERNVSHELKNAMDWLSKRMDEWAADPDPDTEPDPTRREHLREIAETVDIDRKYPRSRP